MTDEPQKDRICVAKIATAHGIKGLVKLHVFVDNIDLVSGDLFTSDNGSDTLNITLKNATAKHWLAKIEGITDRTEAEKLRGTELYIDKSALPEADEGEFYFSDLIGLPAVNEDGSEVGKIISTDNFGAGDLLEIQPAGGESFYLPVTDETVLEILDDKIIVCIPEGLTE
jgi:16S rRNA processing protein RimM